MSNSLIELSGKIQPNDIVALRPEFIEANIINDHYKNDVGLVISVERKKNSKFIEVLWPDGSRIKYSDLVLIKVIDHINMIKELKHLIKLIIIEHMGH